MSTKTTTGVILVAVAIPYPPEYPTDGKLPLPAIVIASPLGETFKTLKLPESAR